MSILDRTYFRSETAAREHLEAIRWTDGPVCPHCGGGGKIYKIKSKSARPGVYMCGRCRRQFTVTVGTLFERSHVPLHKWFQAAFLLYGSKKGISGHQLHRVLGVTYQTAWFMTQRLREAMGDDPLLPGRLGHRARSQGGTDS